MSDSLIWSQAENCPQGFTAYIQHGRQLASIKKIEWVIDLDSSGKALDGVGWDLTFLTGGTPPPRHLLRHFGWDDKTKALMDARRTTSMDAPVLLDTWVCLIKAYVLEALFVRQVKPGSVPQFTRALRVLATVAPAKHPYNLAVEDFRLAVELANQTQPSGTLAVCIRTLAKTLFDLNHLCVASPLSPLLERPVTTHHRRARFAKKTGDLSKTLEERKSSERLPDKRAFWELIRIIFTEKPVSFVDYIRFSQAKIFLLTGLRATEVALLPLDWRRERQYVDTGGRPLGELGGRSSSLLLRHFSKKQDVFEDDSSLLVEAGQHIPDMFREQLTDTLCETERLTQPLRSTLRRQLDTGRLFPWFEQHELIVAPHLLPYVTGNPLWLDLRGDVISSIVERYKKSFDAELLDELQSLQIKSGETRLTYACYMFLSRLKKSGFPFRDSQGNLIHPDSRGNWRGTFVLVSDLEERYRSSAQTKQPDLHPFGLMGGRTVSTPELLFLIPKRSLIDGRNGGICDVKRYFAVGRTDGTTLQHALGEDSRTSKSSFFAAYGETADDKSLKIRTHSFRHLQNTELFRLGVADTIITKRFNRRSIAQSYEYDHRSLVERLDQVDLPDEWAAFLGDSKAATVAKMIKTGQANGPIVREFKRVREQEGDEAAFIFLKAEADGFHSTPYGHCINSFTVDPCPKHLECFTGCRHLSATNLPENRKNLIQLEARLESAVEAAAHKSSNSFGRTNQIAHAQTRLEGVRKLLATAPGKHPFPDGPDLSHNLFRGRSPLDGSKNS